MEELQGGGCQRVGCKEEDRKGLKYPNWRSKTPKGSGMIPSAKVARANPTICLVNNNAHLCAEIKKGHSEDLKR